MKDRNPCVEAKNVLRLLTGEDKIGSTTDESRNSSSKPSSQDSQFGESEQPITIEGTSRQVSTATMQNILRLYDSGMSEKSIQAKYKWFRRQYIDRFLKHINSGPLSYTQLSSLNKPLPLSSHLHPNSRHPP